MNKERQRPINQKYVCFVYCHVTPKTGAHFRFDRLIEEAIKNHEAVFLLGPPRGGFLTYQNVHYPSKRWKETRRFAQVAIIAYVLRSVRELLRWRKYVSYVVVFGETPLVAAQIAAFFCRAKLSVGVRSNVLRRHRLQNPQALRRLLFIVLHSVWRLVYQFTSQIIVQTPEAKAEFINCYQVAPRRVAYLANNVRSTSYNATHVRRLSSNVRMLFVGNNSQIKGFDLLSEVFIVRKYPMISSLTCVGVDESQATTLKATCNSNEVELTIMPWADDIISLMKTHDVLIVPSREDQFPNVVLEAAACNLPVIGSDVDGIAYMLEDPRLLFSPHCTNSIGDCIDFVLSPSGYQAALEALHRIRMRFNFDWEGAYLSLVTNETCPKWCELCG